ncbi:hypothetical protein DV736_g1717, partial [Chaetothyriales sp. CBS 134916]
MTAEELFRLGCSSPVSVELSPSSAAHSFTSFKMGDERQNLLPSDSSSSHSRRSKMFWTLACFYGAAAVGLGAFGAHGLKKKIAEPARIANWGTAAQYQVGGKMVILSS